MLTCASVEIPTAFVMLDPTDSGGSSQHCWVSLEMDALGWVSDKKVTMADFNAGAPVINSDSYAYFRLCCVFHMRHGIFNIHGTPCGPQDVYPANHIFCSISSNFDLTLLVSLPKSVLMSPIPYHHMSVSASDAMIHNEQSGSSIPSPQ